MSQNNRAAWSFPSRTESAGATATALGVLAATGVVGAAYVLGTSWLSTPVFGLPAGVWAVPAVYGLIRWGMVRPRWVASQIAGGVNRLLFGGGRLPCLDRASAGGSMLCELVLGLGGSAASLTARAGLPVVEWFHARTNGRTATPDSLERSFSAWHDRLSWPTRPAHVALVGLTDRARRALLSTESNPGIRWFLGDDRIDDQTLCERHALDAVLTADADGHLRLATHERPGRDASWYDWGARRPISYASVFPGRLDPFLVDVGPADPHEAPVLAALTAAACVLARHPGRLSAVDRARGRRPIDLPVASRQVDDGSHPVVGAMDGLIDAITDWPVGKAPTGSVRIAARIASAWLAGTACGQEPVDRLSGLEAAARILPDEPEALLRLAAVRLAAGRDDAGMESLADADALLRESGEVAQVDPFAFLQAELEAGESNPMTVGRVAAGICMVCTKTPAERLPYLRDDIMDDMRYAEWLVGSDPDRMLLHRVFDEIARSRREPATASLFQAAA